MRTVVAVDGDLLVPADTGRGIPGQREEIGRVASGLGWFLAAGHQVAIVHGNAPQIGYVLLRSEAASHAMHPLPLDVCGSDTQGATGYLLQQALQNWSRQHGLDTEVACLITQVLVDTAERVPGPVRGIGPFYDREKAQLYASTRNWEFVLTAGRGYRRAVPSLKPKHIVEIKSIRRLLADGAAVICAGGGGIPVLADAAGALTGAEVVVDKAYTAGLLAAQVEAETLVFISPPERLGPFLQGCLPAGQSCLPASLLDAALDLAQQLSKDVYHKLSAGRLFLDRGGQRVVFCPPDAVSLAPDRATGFYIEGAPVGAHVATIW